MKLPTLAMQEILLNDRVTGLQILMATNRTFQHCVYRISLFKPEILPDLSGCSAFSFFCTVAFLFPQNYN